VKGSNEISISAFRLYPVCPGEAYLAGGQGRAATAEFQEPLSKTGMLFAMSAIGSRPAEVSVTRRSPVYNPGRAPMILTAGTKLGPYEIQSPLGAGGMGEVYRARDARLDRIVAIKVLPPNLSSDPSLRQRLEREARAISKLSHPNICTLHDIGHQDGIDFLVMEYVEGETLEQRLVRGPLSNQHTLRYAANCRGAGQGA
jgi:serine/threonine protein kinase